MFQSLLMSLTQEASQKMGWLLILFVVVVRIIPSAICHTNEMGGSKTPLCYKRKKKKTSLHKTQHWQTAKWRQQFVQRLRTQVELCAEQFKYYRFPGNSWTRQRLSMKYWNTRKKGDKKKRASEERNVYQHSARLIIAHRRPWVWEKTDATSLCLM